MVLNAYEHALSCSCYGYSTIVRYTLASIWVDLTNIISFSCYGYSGRCAMGSVWVAITTGYNAMSYLHAKFIL